MPQEKPNILLITTDTQRCDTLRCMGNPNAISPNLDKLASEGVLFTQAHTASPVCMPARCSLLTGVHTPTHQCIENGIARRTDLAVFPDALKQQGYTNLMVGKTHFGPVPDSFDVQLKLYGKQSDKEDFYGEHLRKYGYRRATSIPNPVPPDLYMDACTVDRAIESIDACRGNGHPFFCFCSLVSPHGPIDPPGDWADLYNDIPLPPLNYRKGELEEQPVQLRRMTRTLGSNEAPVDRLSEKEIWEKRKLYYGLASYCDEQIGRLIRFLDEKGLRRNTLVIFSSDHGQTYFAHGFDNKHNYYDESWRVPLIFSMPGTLPSGTKREFAVWTDLTASILAAAGTQIPSVQGFDLFTPLCEGGSSPRKCAVATLYKSAALATKGWKVEYYFEEREGRLYNRTVDPCEQKNLFDDPQFHAIRESMLEALLAWRSDLSDVQFLRDTTTGGGPVAEAIAGHTKAMRGEDIEQRLNDAACRIDEKFPAVKYVLK